MKAAWRRYALFQIPGAALAALVATVCWHGGLVSGRTALVAMLAWVLKDALMYPIVKGAYESGERGGADRFVGETGTCVTQVRPLGQIRVCGEIWRARVESGSPLAAGEKVLVLAVEGLTLLVRPLDDAGVGILERAAESATGEVAVERDERGGR